MGVGGADGGQVGPQRLVVQRLDPGLVHVGAVGVGDLLFVRAGDQVGAGHEGLDHRLDPVVGQFAQQGEGAVGGPVRGDLHPVEGRAVGEAHEAVARADRSVAAGQVKTPGPVTGRDRALVTHDRGTLIGGLEQFVDGAALVDAGVAVILAADLCNRDGRGQEQGAERGTDEQFLHGDFLDFASLSDSVGGDPTPRFRPVA
jgi:hypothetical protein